MSFTDFERGLRTPPLSPKDLGPEHTLDTSTTKSRRNGSSKPSTATTLKGSGTRKSSAPMPVPTSIGSIKQARFQQQRQQQQLFGNSPVSPPESILTTASIAGVKLPRGLQVTRGSSRDSIGLDLGPPPPSPTSPMLARKQQQQSSSQSRNPHTQPIPPPTAPRRKTTNANNFNSTNNPALARHSRILDDSTRFDTPRPTLTSSVANAAAAAAADLTRSRSPHAAPPPPPAPAQVKKSNGNNRILSPHRPGDQDRRQILTRTNAAAAAAATSATTAADSYRPLTPSSPSGPTSHPLLLPESSDSGAALLTSFIRNTNNINNNNEDDDIEENGDNSNSNNYSNNNHTVITIDDPTEDVGASLSSTKPTATSSSSSSPTTTIIGEAEEGSVTTPLLSADARHQPRMPSTSLQPLPASTLFPSSTSRKKNDASYQEHDYDMLVRLVSQQIFNISSNVSVLERLVPCLGQRHKDTVELRQSLHAVLDSTQDLVKSAHGQIKVLARYHQPPMAGNASTIGLRVQPTVAMDELKGWQRKLLASRRLTHQRLTKDLSLASRSFQELQKQAIEAERRQVATLRRLSGSASYKRLSSQYYGSSEFVALSPEEIEAAGGALVVDSSYQMDGGTGGRSRTNGYTSGYGSIGTTSYNISGSNGTLVSHDRELSVQEEALLRDILAVDGELVFQESILHEREIEIRKIEEGMDEVMDVMRELGVLVQEQRSGVEYLHDNILQTRGRIQLAQQEVVKASEYQRRSRDKLCYLILVSSIVGAVVMLAFVST